MKSNKNCTITQNGIGPLYKSFSTATNPGYTFIFQMQILTSQNCTVAQQKAERWGLISAE